MSKGCYVFVFFAALVLTLSFAVPREDKPETAYVESESLPCESTPAITLAVTELVPRAPTMRPRISRRYRICVGMPGTQPLDPLTGKAYPFADSLVILDHRLRC